MKVYNENKNTGLSQELCDTLNDIRLNKNFSAAYYSDKKAEYLNKYMTKCGLDSCVVAVSGGIDSAIVLALVNHASKMVNSPIRKIIPIKLPALKNIGVTGQLLADMRGKELCDELGLVGFSVDITPAVQKIREALEPVLELKADNWAVGQLCPYTRTPFLYYTTSLLVANGYHPILVGTTNRDEGAYLGYIGKASDGMVDVQLISDIHKSEVYQVAHHLKVVSSIINTTPTGDMFDNRSDTDVFGASYDFVELYLNYLNKEDNHKEQFKCSLSNEALAEFEELACNLDNMHNYNRHKYISHSPAIHLDLWDSSCPDGWINYYENTRKFMS